MTAPCIFTCARKGDDLARIAAYVANGDVIVFEPLTGYSLCHCAVLCNSFDVLDTLARHTEFVRLASLGDEKDGATPIHTLCRRFASPTAASLDPALFHGFLQRLVVAGVSVHVRDRFGRAPIHVLAGASHDVSSLISLLVSAGADAATPTSTGWTPLHYAAAAGNTINCRTLLHARASASARNSDGITPAGLAPRGSLLAADLASLEAAGGLLSADVAQQVQTAKSAAPQTGEMVCDESVDTDALVSGAAGLC